jgi:hypothetical protein
MKKKQIANLIMVAVILLIVAGGVLGVGYLRGWFDRATKDSACLTRLQGTVNMQRSGVIYPVEKETILRAGDKITTQPGATAVISRGDDTMTLGGNMELTVTGLENDRLVLKVTKGEVFVSSRQSVQLSFALGEVAVENATAALSVREGAQTVSVFRGTVGEAKAGQATEYVGESVSTRDMKLESLNDFLLAQIRKTNKTTTLCYTNQDLDNLEIKRQQAIQDMLNGQNKPDTHTHSYTVLVVAPSCSAGGYTEYTCQCGDTYRAEETAVLAHTWGAWETVKEATTQETGLQKRICSNCQRSEEKITDKIDENHTHSYTFQIVEPTCTTQGYTVHTCNCGHSYTSDPVSAKGHSYTSQIVKPTCETQGYTLSKCACGKIDTDTVTQPTGHSWGDWKTIKEATETAEGQRERTCSACAKKEQQPIAKKEPGIAGYVSIQIRCDTILGNMDDLTPGKAEFVPSNGIILPMVEVPFYENETVFEVLNRICKKANIQIEYSWTPLYGSYYIEGINHLYEFDCGEQSGWMYKVNEWFPNYGCSSYYVEDGDIIVWCYTCKGLGLDVGCEWMGQEG